MIEDALSYARLGLRVFPCHTVRDGVCSCGDAECKSPGKHPRVPRGSSEATTDPEQVAAWWEKWPDANIAIATGAGLLALDVDLRDDKDGTLWLAAMRPDLPDTVEQVTPTGGAHLLYMYPQHLTVRNSTDALCRGVDVRGEGGYIMASPSLHLFGVYEWRDGPEDCEIAEAPAWLLEQIATSHERERAHGAERWRVSLPLDADRKAELVSALDAIDPDNRDVWLRVGMAIHSEHADEAGFTLWCEWSQRSPKFDFKDQRYTWQRFDSYGGVSVAAIFGMARDAGWSPPTPVAELPDVVPYVAPDAAEDFPAHLLDAGRVGLIGEMCQWMDACAIRPQPLASMVAAYCAAGTIYGRNYEGASGVRTNLYCVTVLPSGSGKDNARKCLKRLFTTAGANDLLGGEELASDAGLLAALERSPVGLFLLDEIGYFFANLAGVRAPDWVKKVKPLLLTLFSSSDTTYQGKERGGQERTTIECPHAVLYGTTTPLFFGSLSTEDAVSGFLNRFLVFPGEAEYPEPREPETRASRLTSRHSVVELFKHHLEAAKDAGQKESAALYGNLTAMSGRVAAKPVEDSQGATDVFRALTAEEDRRKQSEDTRLVPVWSRMGEQARKLALIRALSRDINAPRVSREDAEFGAGVAVWCASRVVHEMRENVAESKSQEDRQYVLRVLREMGSCTGSELTRRTQKLSARERKAALAELEEMGFAQQARDPRRPRAIVWVATMPAVV